MTDDAVDMILVLSSEIVCQMAEQHFNTKMFRQSKKVRVIDLKATEQGLVQFNVEFVKSVAQLPALQDVAAALQLKDLDGAMSRDERGRFIRLKGGRDYGEK